MKIYLDNRELKRLVIEKLIDEIIFQFETEYYEQEWSEEKLREFLISEQDYFNNLILTKEQILDIPLKFKLYVNSKQLEKIAVKDIIPVINIDYLLEISKEKFLNTVPF